MEKRFLAMRMWLCEGKLKVKIAQSLRVAVRVSKTRVLKLPNIFRVQVWRQSYANEQECKQQRHKDRSIKYPPSARRRELNAVLEEKWRWRYI